ncbi:hypothetical protein ACFSR7_25220 [Cohnella sp. GCM10020058]|uniref:hypothetical protein n=1 Tax=Cohnella sp. GCM10020058 TaxID=3317330 RepID=UPI003640A306
MIAALFSILMPGFGQINNRQFLKGALLLMKKPNEFGRRSPRRNREAHGQDHQRANEFILRIVASLLSVILGIFDETPRRRDLRRFE